MVLVIKYNYWISIAMGVIITVIVCVVIGCRRFCKLNIILVQLLAGWMVCKMLGSGGGYSRKVDSGTFLTFTYPDK